MKIARFFCSTTLVAGVSGVLCCLAFAAAPLVAQEANEEEMAPAAEIDLEAVSADGTVAPAMFDPLLDEPLPLLPDLPSSGDGAGFFDTAPAGISTADRLRAAIRIRELKTLSLREPEIIAQKELAQNAKTYEGERTALRNFYTLLSRSIIKKDASVKEPVEAELAVKLRRLEQDKVRPSVLIEAIEPVPGSRAQQPVAVVVEETVEEVVEPVKKKRGE